METLVFLRFSRSMRPSHGLPPVLRLGIFALAWVSGCARGLPAPSTPLPLAPAEEPERVHFVGRMDWSGAEGPRFAWPGSSMTVRFRGPLLEVDLRESGEGNRYQVEVDGAPVSVLETHAGAGQYALTALPADGQPHTLTLFRRTEALFGTTQFLGFRGTTERHAYTRMPLLEIVGDSISVGSGIEGENASCAFDARTQNAYASYGAVAGRALEADVRIVAMSGKGAQRNWDGRTDETLVDLYDRTLPGDPASRWEGGARSSADLVVVNVGTNDFALGDPGSAFLSAYRTLLEKVRAKNPRARLFAAVGPLANPETQKQLLAAVTEVTSGLGRSPADAVRVVDLGAIDPADGFGCASHPNVRSHAKAAAALVAAIRAREAEQPTAPGKRSP